MASILAVGLQLALMTSAGAQTLDSVSGYFEFGPTIMQRSQSQAVGIVEEYFVGTPYLNGDDLEFGWDLGLEGKLGISFVPDSTLEMRFLSIGSEASAAFLTPGNYSAGGFAGSIGTAIGAEYETDLQSLEVNWHQQVFDRVTLLAGVRAMNLTDALSLDIDGFAQANYSYNNRYLGAQIGAEFAVLDPSSPFQLDLSGKVGLFSLNSEGGIERSIGGVPFESHANAFEETTYAAELGVSAGYQLTDQIQIGAGYQILWIDAAALAGENAASSAVDPSVIGSTTERGSLFYQGVKLDLKVAF